MLPEHPGRPSRWNDDPGLRLVAGLFVLLFGRAAIRALWSLVRDEADVVTATVGLLRPWVLFSPIWRRR
jgi:hypothetical protein